MPRDHERYTESTRRQFLRTAIGGGAGALLAARAGYAHHHPKPTASSLTYLDQKMYIHNMEVISHVQSNHPAHAPGRIEMMSTGSRRYLFTSGGDIYDVSDPRRAVMVSHGTFSGSKLQLNYRAQLKKWVLLANSMPPFLGDTPGGKYDDPGALETFRDWKGLRGIRLYDATDPTKLELMNEHSTGQTGAGTHNIYYDGGRYAYLASAPDDTFTGVGSAIIAVTTAMMIVDVSDPLNVEQVAMWWLPGMRTGEEDALRQWPQWKYFESEPVDRRPYTKLQGPVYVPRRIGVNPAAYDDEICPGRRGYGSWGALGFMLHDLSDIKNPKLLGRFSTSPPYQGGIPFHSIYVGMLDRGFVIGNPEALNPDCNEDYLPIWVIDVRNEEYPIGIAQFPRPKPPADAPYNDFCQKRGRFGAHNPIELKAPGRISPTFAAVAQFNAGLRCYDLTEPTRPEETAYFIPPQGGVITNPDSFNRTVECVFVEWDRKVMYVTTTTGLYALATPALGKPMLDPMPVSEWSLPGLNAGAP